MFLSDEVGGGLDHFLKDIRVRKKGRAGKFEILGEGAGGFGDGCTRTILAEVYTDFLAETSLEDRIRGLMNRVHIMYIFDVSE